MNRFHPLLTVLVLFGLAACDASSADGPEPANSAPSAVEFEVWAADQNLNQVYILGPDGEVLRTIDASELGGADRPHMLWGVPGDGYVYSANTVSASVSILDRRSGEVVEVIEEVGQAPHAAQPNPTRPDRIYVFNIAPQESDADGMPDRGETIAEIVRTDGADGPSWELTRFLDLRADPALADSDLFPSRRPVCGGFSPDGSHLLVTLFNGGLAVVDLDGWSVSRAWGSDEIAEHGCGFASSLDGEEIYVTAGGMHESWMYVFDVGGAEPQLVATHDLSGAGQDAHGVYVDPVRDELWVVHRASDNITIHPLASIQTEGHDFETIDFVGSAPDLVAFSPDASRAYLTLRGPNPAPTIPHATVGETPGVTIIDVPGREVLEIVPLGDQIEADFHGIFIPEANHGIGGS